MSSVAHQTSKTAVFVSGASSGIGLAVVLAAANAGYKVYAAAHTDVGLNKLRALEHKSIVPLLVDVNNDDQIKEAKACILSDSQSQLGAVINNAGFCTTGELMHSSREELMKMLATNAVAPIAVSKILAPLLSIHGKIINIDSTASQVPSSPNGGYCASKAALRSFSDVLRLELISRKIEVITIQPGIVTTPFWEKIAMHERKIPQLSYRREMLLNFSKNGGSSPKLIADEITAVPLTFI